ncbi:hypothetical protein DFP72DRAFT_760064, partial [Ephemerocybe angulata]
ELDVDDVSLLRAWNWKTTHNITDAAFDDLGSTFPHYSNLPKAKAARRRIEFLAKFKATYQQCCVNSCINYVGPNEDLDKCPYCKQLRYNAQGKPRKVWRPIPIIPQLRAYYRNPTITEQMKYRHNFEHKVGIIQDVYDGIVYNTLRETYVEVGGIPRDYKFFSQETDVALGFATDGFNIWKNGQSTC